MLASIRPAFIVGEPGPRIIKRAEVHVFAAGPRTLMAKQLPLLVGHDEMNAFGVLELHGGVLEDGSQ